MNKTICLFISLLTVLSLTGCGTKNDLENPETFNVKFLFENRTEVRYAVYSHKEGQVVDSGLFDGTAYDVNLPKGKYTVFMHHARGDEFNETFEVAGDDERRVTLLPVSEHQPSIKFVDDKGHGVSGIEVCFWINEQPMNPNRRASFLNSEVASNQVRLHTDIDGFVYPKLLGVAPNRIKIYTTDIKVSRLNEEVMFAELMSGANTFTINLLKYNGSLSIIGPDDKLLVTDDSANSPSSYRFITVEFSSYPDGKGGSLNLALEGDKIFLYGMADGIYMVGEIRGFTGDAKRKVFKAPSNQKITIQNGKLSGENVIKIL
ncbi:hypothetical protein P3T73_06845 [Kiritimatiellota bacterium B12222]|nr:hypothetical protein P3T73_06845 [Kiritimatiellota bacterium B12222]